MKWIRRVQGSRFRPALARRDVPVKVFPPAMGLAFHHPILKCPVWARGLKVIIDSGYLILDAGWGLLDAGCWSARSGDPAKRGYSMKNRN